MSVAPITLPTPPTAAAVEEVRTVAGDATSGVDLGDAFSEVLREATSLEKASGELANRFAAGDPTVGIHEVMIASEKSGIALRFATTLKNKALDAYRELMSTQV